MSDQQIMCMVCRTTFIHTEREQQFLEALHREGKLHEVCLPKRCAACRQKKREPLKSALPALPMPIMPLPSREVLRDVEYLEPSPAAPLPTVSAVKYDPAPIEPDLRCVMVAGDFEKLVCREEVVLRVGNRKVTLVLANIGLPAMKAAVEKGVLAWWRS